MVELSEELVFAEGGRRVCFIHPDDSSRCVKILNRRGDPVRRRNKAAWYKRLRPLSMFDDNLREFDSFRALEKKGGAVWLHFPRCYGIHPTSRGGGIVCDLIRDDDGRVSRSLRKYVTAEGKTRALQNALEDFFECLQGQIVLTRDILDHNLLVQNREEGLRVVMIDGFGCSEAIPISRWLPVIGRCKVRRKISRFRRRYGF